MVRKPLGTRAAAPQAPVAPAQAGGAAGAPAPGKPNRPPTDFEERVYALCSAVPKGKVTTYGDLAAALSPPSAARAVGQAMRRNPFAPRVPCHRVVAGDLRLGGFNGSWGASCASVQRKRAMLLEEGVAIDGDRVAGACVVHAAELRKLGAAAVAAKGKGGE